MMNKKDRILEAFRSDAQGKEFSWERHNCVSFSVNILKALYGIDKGNKYPILGKSKLEYYRMLKNTNKKLSDLVTEELGKPISNPKLARKGDLIIEGEGFDQNMGICYGKGVALLPKEKGLFTINLSRCTYAWSMKVYG